MKDRIEGLTSELNGRVDRAVLDSVRGRLERAFRDLDRDKRDAKAEAASLVLRVRELEAEVRRLEAELRDRRVEAESLEQRLRDADLGRRRAEASVEELRTPTVDASAVDWDLLDKLATDVDVRKATDFCSGLAKAFRDNFALTALRNYDARLAAWSLRLSPSALFMLMHLAVSELNLWRSLCRDHTKVNFRFVHVPVAGIAMTDEAKQALGPDSTPRSMLDLMIQGDVWVDGSVLKAKGE